MAPAPPPQRRQDFVDYLKEPPFFLIYVACMLLFFGLTVVNAMNASVSQGALAGTVIYGIVFLVFFSGILWILPLIVKKCKRGDGAPIPSTSATAPPHPQQPQPQAIPFDQKAINIANPMRV